ncbi:MAG: GntR family transcriptional regulator [Pseudomonadota bacterium]
MPAQATFDALDLGAVSSSRSEPLYHQIYQIIRSKILSHMALPGEQIPGERPLGSVFGVSTITARKALELLAEEGLIKRQRGRGNVILDFEERASGAEGTVLELDELSSKTRLTLSRVDVNELRRPPPSIATLLGLGPDSQINFVAGASRQIGTYCESWNMRAREVSGVAAPLGWELAADSPLPIRQVRQVVTATRVSIRAMETLGLSPGDPVLRIARQLLCDDVTIAYMCLENHPGCRGIQTAAVTSPR